MKRTKLLCLLLALAIIIPILPLQVSATTGDTESATTATSQINGISLTQKGTTGGGVMLEQHALSTMALSNATNFVINYYNPTGVAWPFYVIFQNATTHQQITLKDGVEYKVYNNKFNLVETKAVQYNAVAPTAKGEGYIVIPATAFEGVTTVEAIYIVLPAGAEAQIGVTSVHFAKVGIYTQETPDLANDMTVLTDFGNWTDAWFAGRITDVNGVEPKIVKKEVLEQGSIDGIRITQTACNGYAEEGVMINMFTNNSASVDLTNVKWIAFEYANLSVEARTALVKLQDSNGVQAYANTNTNVIHTDANFKNAKTITKIDPYLRTTASFVGWVFVPMSAYANMGMGNNLVAIYLLLNSYDAALNGSAIEFGRIMTFTEEIITDYSKGTVIADLTSWTDEDINLRIATSSATRITEIKKVEKADVVVETPITCDLGDVRILEDFTAGYPTDTNEYNTLMSNKVDPMVGGLIAEKYPEEIHEGDALKLTVVEPIENKRDDYAAITFGVKSSVNKWMQWKNDEGNIEGITFFVSNISGAEVTLCFEIDEYDPDQDVSADYRGERWSVGLGGRVILYDTVTGKQMLIHSNPMVSIPAGFTGWVRIPVSCFTKAAWCTWGTSTFDLVRIAQFTFAAYGPINMGNSFVLDSVGLYYNQTVVESIFGDNGNSIADNLK